MPEVTSHLVITTALLLSDPTVDGLCADHLFSLQLETPTDLLRTVVVVDDEPSNGTFHLIGEFQVVSPRLYPSLILLLCRFPLVTVITTHIDVPPNLTAHRSGTDPDYFSHLPLAHRCLQRRRYRISLLPRQMLVSHPQSLFCCDSKVIL